MRRQTDMQIWRAMAENPPTEAMYQHMNVLVEEVGERLSGTKEMRQAAAYIKRRLREFGLDARIDHFPMYHSFPGEAQLKVIYPKTITVDVRPVGHISSTLPCGVEGELIYLGVGGYEDYEGVDATGKVVLTDMNWNPSRPEKARIAWEKGAKALVIMNWGKADDPLIQMGAVKSQWGNPTPETFGDIPQITVLSISRASGESLKELCQTSQEPVRVWLKAEATREWVQAEQVTARIRGGKNESGQYVLVGSHVDAWGKSAICNASGNALTLEMARYLNGCRDQLKRDVVFVFWDGHEIAEGGGSTWYCDTHWKDLTDNCVAYINIDNLAIKGTSEPGVEGQPEMKAFLMESIETVWKRPGVWNHAYKGGGDSSFFGVGVPYISFATEYTEELLKELNYAFYSPWLHSDSDTVDKIDRELYKKHYQYFSYILCQLLQRDVVPYNVRDLAEDVNRQLAQVLQAAGPVQDQLIDLKEAGRRYREVAEVLQQVACQENLPEEGRQTLNRALLMFERSSAVFRSVAGRYGQDACGYLKTEKPVPPLWDALRELNRHEAGSHQYNLWFTKVLREKNRVYDSLNLPVRYAEEILHCLNGYEKR